MIFVLFAHALVLYLYRKKRASKDGKNPSIMALFQTKTKHIKKVPKMQLLSHFEVQCTWPSLHEILGPKTIQTISPYFHNQYLLFYAILFSFYLNKTK